MNRRDFLLLSGAGAFGALAPQSALALADSAAPALRPGSFDFVFFTDTHIQPELWATDGCIQCFKRIARLDLDFAIQGGDHVFDSLNVGPERAKHLFDLYAQTQQRLNVPVYHTIGNHDVFGVGPKSGVAPSELGYGKKLFADQNGATYRSFDHKGYHFIILDSIHPEPGQGDGWIPFVDEGQLQWLERDLMTVGPTAPIVVSVHVPLVTALEHYIPPPETPAPNPGGTVRNAYRVLKLLAGHNVLGVLQGHTHINESITYKGCEYITSGAVCGNWWHGARWGHPEGFTVVSLREGTLSHRYETYGFKSFDQGPSPEDGPAI